MGHRALDSAHGKFWHPLPFWQVVVIGIAAQLVCTIPVVALQELAGIVMYLTVRAFAKRKLEAKP